MWAQNRRSSALYSQRRLWGFEPQALNWASETSETSETSVWTAQDAQSRSIYT